MRIDRKPKWDGALIERALNLLKKNDPEAVVAELGVSWQSMRMALSRRGIRLSQFKKKCSYGRLKRSRAFVKSTGLNRPFEAMAAMESDLGGCRFPLGDLDKGNFRFCGREAKKSYCAHHHKIVYIPGSATMTMEEYEAHLFGKKSA